MIKVKYNNKEIFLDEENYGTGVLEDREDLEKTQEVKTHKNLEDTLILEELNNE